MSLNYTKKTMHHFRNPKNIGEIKNPDARAEVGNIICGDQLLFTLKVKNDKIQNIKFLSFGCASNIATASVMTEMVKGLTLKEAKKFDWNKIVKKLNGLPQQKIHCSVLAVEGLRQVIKNYEEKLVQEKGKKVKASTQVPKKIKKSKTSQGLQKNKDLTLGSKKKTETSSKKKKRSKK